MPSGGMLYHLDDADVMAMTGGEAIRLSDAELPLI